MTAVHLDAGQVTVRDVPRPDPPPGHALIRVLCAGVCNTDLELQRGYYGFSGQPGHEFVGVVEQSPDPWWVGRRVVGEINLACETCDWCARGMKRHCPNRTVLGIVRHPGAFAEYVTLPVRNLHSVPDFVPNEHAVFAEPVAAACEVLEQVEIPAGSDAAVLGDGKLGLLVAQVLQGFGVRTHLFGRHPHKLAIAEAVGVTAHANADPPTAAYDFVVDATGSPHGLAQAVAMTRPRGTVVMKSTVHRPVALDMAPVIVNEISLVGSRCGPFQPALRLLKAGRLNIQPMVSARFPFADAPEAFARAAAHGTLKVLLEP